MAAGSSPVIVVCIAFPELVHWWLLVHSSPGIVDCTAFLRRLYAYEYHLSSLVLVVS
jgi:hypothetical protein